MLLTLTIAVGATAAVFAVVEAVILRSFPYREPSQLVVLHDEYLGIDATELGLSGPEYFEYADAAEEVRSVAAYRTGRVTLALNAPEKIDAAYLSEGLLGLLGAGLELGRVPTADERHEGGPPVALVSHRFWRQRLSGQTRLDRLPTLRIDDESHRIIGVLDQSFRLPSDLSRSDDRGIYLPLRLGRSSPGHRQNPVLDVVGRLAPGATIESARSELARFAESLRGNHPGDYPERLGFQMTLRPLAEEVVGDVRQILLVVCSAVGLLFVIAIANVTGLVLARLSEEQREVGIRLAVGARTRHFLRHFLSESLLLTVLSTVPGILLAYLLCRALLMVHADSIPRLYELRLDYWALIFAGATAVMIALLLVVPPLMRIGRTQAVQTMLRRGPLMSAVSGGPGSGRRALVVGQLALTLALTIGAGFLITSYRNLHNEDLGFEKQGVLAINLVLPSSHYAEPPQVLSFFDRMLERVRALPGVEQASLVTFLPLEQALEVWPIELGGSSMEGGRPPTGVRAQIVSEGYFRSLGIPLLEGRDFERADAAGRPVVLVNRAFARVFLADREAVGGRLRARLSTDAPWASIIGVVGDVRHQTPREEPRPCVYFYFRQIPLYAGVAVRSMNLALRSTGPPQREVAPVRQVINALDDDLPLGSVRTFEEVLASSTARSRFPTQALSLFAGIALLVSLAGIYGLLSHSVAGSTREIGIRAALGATPRRITLSVLRQGLTLTGLALVLGMVIAIALVGLIGHLLYGVGEGDLSVYGVAGLALALAATLACYLPARRAAALDPIHAMRQEP